MHKDNLANIDILDNTIYKRVQNQHQNCKPFSCFLLMTYIWETVILIFL